MQEIKSQIISRTTLLSHQQQAINKLKGLRVGALFMEMGTGKALPLDTPLLTPFGWTKMKDVQVGDFVTGASGFPVKVIGVYPQGDQDVYEITFSDGSKAQCSEDHLWEVNTPLRKWRNMPPIVLSLKEIKKQGIKHANGNRKFFIPLVEPVFFNTDSALPIHPYVLGALLGDGCMRKTSITFSSADMQTVELIAKRLPEECCLVKRSKYDYSIVGRTRFRNPLLKILRDLSLAEKTAEFKFIPKMYLFCSAQDRLELLRGLLDTDGSVSGAGIEFSTASKQLAKDVQFLVQSLGGLAKINEKNTSFSYKGIKKEGKLAYRIYIRFSSNEEYFTLSRKKVKHREKYNPVRSIESISYVGKKSVQCIKVDSADGLFVINDFIVTHNTRCLIEFALLRQYKIDRVIYFCPVNLKDTVRREIEKHVFNPSVYVFSEKTKQGKIPEAFFYIVGVESIGQSDRVTLAANELITENSFVILDESDTCKNHAAVRTQRITTMASRARYKTIATGTPVGEGVVDLFAQLYFLSPDILGYKSFYSFAANHLEYDEDRPGLIIRSHNTDCIAKKLEPFAYQCKKDECLDLPDKQYLSRYFSMGWEQRCLYDRAKQEILMSVPDDEIDQYTIFRMFTALREIVSGFWNRNPDPNPYHWWAEKFEPEYLTVEHDRVDLLTTVVSEIPDHERVIIWVNFHHCIKQVVAALSEEYGVDSIAQYHGLTEDKEAELNRWRNSARFLIASPKCGGRGLTLNECAYTVFYNNDFPYRVREQAEDRNHRIGQTRKPTYIDLICDRSIDDRIFRALLKKESLVAEFKREMDKLKPKDFKKRLAAL